LKIVRQIGFAGKRNAGNKQNARNFSTAGDPQVIPA